MIYTFDGRGKQCPEPLINTRQLLKKMVSGDECIIIISDQGSINDIPNYLTQKGYAYHKEIIDKQIVRLTVKI